MFRLKPLLATLILVPALILGCGKSADDNDNDKSRPFGDEFTLNSSGSVMDVLFDDDRFDEMSSNAVRTNIANTLDRQGPFTIFAFTDSAFRSLPRRARLRLLNSRRMMQELLLYHVVDREYSYSEVQDRISLRSLQGDRIRVRLRNGSVFVSGKRISQYNGFVGNGVVHVINDVMIPPSLRTTLGL